MMCALVLVNGSQASRGDEHPSKPAHSGGMVLGICQWLPDFARSRAACADDAQTAGLRYICRHVYIRVEQTDNRLPTPRSVAQILKVPIAQNDGKLHCDEATIGGPREKIDRSFSATRRRTDRMTPTAIQR